LLEEAYYSSSTTNCFVAYDGNGDVVALVNSADGTVSANYEYDPFGQVIRATGLMAKANPFRFSTKYQDDESGLNYYGYRFYNPSGGTWLSRDPLEEESSDNLYGFVANEGVNDVDAYGLWQIQRKGDDRALAIADKGDTVTTLAQMINFDDKDFTSWLQPVNGGKMPASKSESVPSCQYSIPNTIYIEFGDFNGWWDWFGPIPQWRDQSLGRKVFFDGDGFNVVLREPSGVSALQ
jgi:RHS repeat-associated protein